MNKEAKRLLKALEAQGWRVDQRKSGAMLLFPPDPQYGPVTMHGTPSDHRAMANLLAELRKRGYKS